MFKTQFSHLCERMGVYSTYIFICVCEYGCMCLYINYLHMDIGPYGKTRVSSQQNSQPSTVQLFIFLSTKFKVQQESSGPALDLIKNTYLFLANRGTRARPRDAWKTTPSLKTCLLQFLERSFHFVSILFIFIIRILLCVYLFRFVVPLLRYFFVDEVCLRTYISMFVLICIVLTLFA